MPRILTGERSINSITVSVFLWETHLKLLKSLSSTQEPVLDALDPFRLQSVLSMLLPDPHDGPVAT